MSHLFGTEIFKFTNGSASLNPTGISASFNILFRGIIIDVFVRSSSKNDIIPPVPFFIVNSCYTVLKETNSRFEHIYNYSYHNHKESNSYITQESFFKSCFQRHLAIHPFWMQAKLDKKKASKRLFQIHFLNRFSKMIEKGYTANEEEQTFYSNILEIVHNLTCFVCQQSLQEDKEQPVEDKEEHKIRLYVTPCCHAIFHDDCIPESEKRDFLYPNRCNNCLHKCDKMIPTLVGLTGKTVSWNAS